MDGWPQAFEAAAAPALAPVPAVAAAPAATGFDGEPTERALANPVASYRIAVAHTAAAPAAFYAGAALGTIAAGAPPSNAGPDAPRAAAAAAPGPQYRSGVVQFCHYDSGNPIQDADVRGALLRAAPQLRFRVAFGDGTTTDMRLQQVVDAYTQAAQAGAPRRGGSLIEECIAELVAARQPISRDPRPRPAAAPAVAQQAQAQAAPPAPVPHFDMETQQHLPGDDPLAASQQPQAVLLPGAAVPPRKFRGVIFRSTRGGCWQARIREGNADVEIGLYPDQITAAKAWDDRNRELGGTEANFPDASRGETQARTGRGCSSTREFRTKKAAARSAKRRRDQAEADAGAEPRAPRVRRPPRHMTADHITGVFAAHVGGEDDPPAPQRPRRRSAQRVIAPLSDEDDSSDDTGDDAGDQEHENEDDDDDDDGVEDDDGEYYRGVSRSVKGSYSACIYVSRDAPPRHLGTFRSRAEAARAWDKAARSLGRKEMNFPDAPGETRITPRQQTMRKCGGGAAGSRQVLAPPQHQAPAPEVPRTTQAAHMTPYRPPPPPPRALPTAVELPTPTPPAEAVDVAAAPGLDDADAAAPAATAPLTTLELVSAIRPPLVDAAGVAALLVAADYATVEQLAVLRGGAQAERHAELEMLGVRSHFNRVQLLRAIDALPPPPPPPTV